MAIKIIWSKAMNLFGGNTYFDKQVTIQKYFSMVDEEDRPHVDSFEDLYEVALQHVEKQYFKDYANEMPDYFYQLSPTDAIVALCLGIVAFGIATSIDSKGKDIENSIDKLLPKNYDVNNAFDLQHGKGHRIFGHDIPTFGIRNIPADFAVKIKDGTDKFQYAKLCDYLGIYDKEKFSMWDIIWVFYGDNEKKFKGIMNCLGHTIAHFGKDLFTTDGLPLPFTTLFNEFTTSPNYDGIILKYKNSFSQKLDTRRLFMKASDFVSVILIEGFIEYYCNKSKTNDIVGFRHNMKLLAMGTCLSLQLSAILIAEGIQEKKGAVRKNVPGGKINVLMSGILLKLSIQEMRSVIKARLDINDYFKELLEEQKT